MTCNYSAVCEAGYGRDGPSCVQCNSGFSSWAGDDMCRSCGDNSDTNGAVRSTSQDACSEYQTINNKILILELVKPTN